MHLNKIAVYVNKSKDPELKFAGEVETFLRERKVYCTISDHTVDPESDMVLVLGGDGTVLRAVREMGNSQKPVLGINLGTLGYLTEADGSSWKDALEQILTGEYFLESRMMLEGGRSRQVALNDVVITRLGVLRILSCKVYVNGHFLNTFQADGIIISTPTGSTAYNLSAGGPIVEPTAQMLLLTPICPHTVNTRSIVLAADRRIEIEIGTEERHGDELPEAAVIFDGVEGDRLLRGEKIEIAVSDRSMKLIRLSNKSFLETLHRKMTIR